jgi:hypothetical protein
VVSRIIDPGKGNKRKVRQVRWTRAEMVSAILLLLVLMGETVIIALWLKGHPFD